MKKNLTTLLLNCSPAKTEELGNLSETTPCIDASKNNQKNQITKCARFFNYVFNCTIMTFAIRIKKSVAEFTNDKKITNYKYLICK